MMLLFVSYGFYIWILTGQGYDLSHNKVKAEIRKHLLKDYDKIIGPVKYGNTQYLEVQFRLSITNLVEVVWTDIFIFFFTKIC